MSLMWYVCLGGQTESNDGDDSDLYTAVLLMCVSCVPVPCLGAGFLRFLSHAALFRSCCLLLSCPHAMVCPLLHCKKKKRAKKEDRRKQRQQERTEKGKKNGPGRSRASKFCVSTRMPKEGNATPIGQQVLLLQCVSDVVSMPWWPD